MYVGNKTAKRHEKIRALLIANNVVTLNEFCERLKCSESTIRNDLKYLEEQGLITRTFGGAVANESTKYNISMNMRSKLHIEEKKQIARYIVDHMLSPECIVTMDTGTTIVEIAKAIFESALKLTVITTSLAVANILNKSDNIKLFLAGGLYHHSKDAFIDHTAINFIKSMRSDIYIMSCDGVNADVGFTISDPEETYIKQTMAQCSKKTIATLDSSKLGNVCLKVICNINEVDTIVTDSFVTKVQLDPLASAGLNIMIAGVQ